MLNPSNDQQLKIGLFGGSFDPIHLGHVEIVQMVMKKIQLDYLIVMPAGKAPHKHGSFFSDELRLEMAKAAMNDLNNDKIIVSDWEINQAKIKGKPSFTVDTMRYLQKKYPHALLYLILGADMFNTLSTWKDPDVIASNMKLVLINRSDTSRVNSNNKIIETIYKPDIVISHAPMPISSTEIRQRLSTGKSVTEFVPASALQVLSNYAPPLR